jgi:DNA polymerase III sliding clamp (beta) subunit (PCNA family)
MKLITLPVGVLSAAIKTVAPAVGLKTVIPVMENVHVDATADALVFTTHNMNIGMCFKLPHALAAGVKPFTFLIDFTTLTRILEALPKEAEISLQVAEDGTHIKVTSGKDTYKLGTENPKDFAIPKQPTAEPIPLTNNAWQAMQTAVGACAKESIGNANESLFVEIMDSGQEKAVVFATGTNNGILFHQKVSNLTGKINGVLVPQGMLRAAKDFDGETATLSFDENRIALTNGTVTITAVLPTGKFPDYRVVLVKEPGNIAINGTEWASALKKLLAVTPDTTNAVTLTQTGKDVIAITAENIDFSNEGNTTVNIGLIGDAVGGEMKYNARTWLHVLDMFEEADQPLSVYMQPGKYTCIRNAQNTKLAMLPSFTN